MLGPNQIGRPEASGSLAVAGPKEVRTSRISVGEVVQRRGLATTTGRYHRDARTVALFTSLRGVS